MMYYEYNEFMADYILNLFPFDEAVEFVQVWLLFQLLRQHDACCQHCIELPAGPAGVDAVMDPQEESSAS